MPETSFLNGQAVSHYRVLEKLGSGWSADGRLFDIEVTRVGVSDIWRQTLSGGPAKQLTYFSSDLISFFKWSGDGKTLAASRGTRTADICPAQSLQDAVA